LIAVCQLNLKSDYSLVMSELCHICGIHSLVVAVKRLKFVNIVIPENSSNLGYTILPMCLSSNLGYTILPMCLYGIALHPYSPE